jgi:hypothetical protein
MALPDPLVANGPAQASTGVEVSYPEITAAALLAQLTREMSRRLAAGPVPDGAAAGPRGPVWEQIDEYLRIAEQHAYIGRSVPRFHRFRGLSRRLARLVARGFLYLCQVFTNGQRAYNVATVNALRELGHALRRLEERQQESFRKLEELQRRGLCDREARTRHEESASR